MKPQPSSAPVAPPATAESVNKPWSAMTRSKAEASTSTDQPMSDVDTNPHEAENERWRKRNKEARESPGWGHSLLNDQDVDRSPAPISDTQVMSVHPCPGSSGRGSRPPTSRGALLMAPVTVGVVRETISRRRAQAAWFTD